MNDYFESYLASIKEAAKYKTVIEILIERLEDGEVEYAIEYAKQMLETTND